MIWDKASWIYYRGNENIKIIEQQPNLKGKNVLLSIECYLYFLSSFPVKTAALKRYTLPLWINYRYHLFNFTNYKSLSIATALPEMAAAITGVGVSCPSKLTQPAVNHRHRPRCAPVIRMTLVEEKKKSYTLKKSEEAFNAAKVLW